MHPEDPLALLLADLAHAGLVAHQTLAPLTTSEATELLDSVLEDRATTVEHPLRERVLKRTGGVPFFLVSCAQEMRLRESEGEGGLEDTVPWDVTQGVRQRAAMLPPAAREVVGAAAVMGRVVPRPLLEDAVTQPETELLTALAAACRARLLEEVGNDAYQFAHDVIHEVVRADLGAAQRAALHRRVAEALERAPGEAPVELLAYHYERAGAYARAITYLVAAAERARQRVAYREEVGLLAQAIALAQRLGQDGRVADLRAMRGKAFANAEMWPEARAELEAALEGLGRERAEQRAEVLVDLAKVYWWSLDCPTSGRYASEALELAEKAGREDLAALAITYMAQAHKSEGQMLRSIALYRRALSRAEGERLPALRESAPVALYLVGRIDEAIRLGREAVATIREWKDAGAGVNAMTNLGLALGAGGRYEEAMGMFEEARRFASDVDLRTMLARATACATGLHLDVFDYAGAEARATEAYEMARAVWLPSVVSAGIDLLFIFTRNGEVSRAEALVDEVVRLSELPGSFHEWLWRIRLSEARAEIALARGDWEHARRWVTYSLRQSLKSRRVKYQVIGLGTRAQIHAALGQVKKAIIDLRRALKLARLLGDPAQFLRAATLLLTLDGDDILAAEARATADRIAAALPDETMRRRFRDAEAVRGLGRR